MTEGGPCLGLLTAIAPGGHNDLARQPVGFRSLGLRRSGTLGIAPRRHALGEATQKETACCEGEAEEEPVKDQSPTDGSVIGNEAA